MEIEAGDAIGAVLHKGDGVTEKITAWPGDGKGAVRQVAEKTKFQPMEKSEKGVFGRDFHGILFVEAGMQEKRSNDVQV